MYVLLNYLSFCENIDRPKNLYHCIDLLLINSYTLRNILRNLTISGIQNTNISKGSGCISGLLNFKDFLLINSYTFRNILRNLTISGIENAKFQMTRFNKL